MKNYNAEPLSTLNSYLNAAVEAAESLTGYATNEALTAGLAQKADLSAIPQGGDYLPLSGGNLSGRIYLKTTTGGQTIDTSMVVGYYSDENCNAEISVYASEEYLRSGGGGAGTTTNCSVKVYDKSADVSSDVSITLDSSWTPDPDTEEDAYDGTWQGTVGDLEQGEDTWDIIVTAAPSAADGALTADISWENSEGTASVGTGGTLSNPTADTTVETTTPFVTSADVDAVIGDINSILDSINGQTI